MLCLTLVLAGCGHYVDRGSSGDVAAPVTGSVEPEPASLADEASDDFERATLGENWRVVYPPGNNGQVGIIDHSDLGMKPGRLGFFLVNWQADTFAADQFCEATLPDNATPGWAYMVYVRWRARDAARYGFAYNSDPRHSTFGSWIFKYDGVPTAQTRIIASTPASVIPGPGDTIRVEVEGFTLRGYLNGKLVLQATDTDPTRIAAGEIGLAARWATGNQASKVASRVWGSWRGGSLTTSASAVAID